VKKAIFWWSPRFWPNGLAGAGVIEKVPKLFGIIFLDVPTQSNVAACRMDRLNIGGTTNSGQAEHGNQQ
jgi:hypothetical protein